MTCVTSRLDKHAHTLTNKQIHMQIDRFITPPHFSHFSFWTALPTSLFSVYPVLHHTVLHCITAEAKSAGLWNLFMPIETDKGKYGAGLTNLEVNRCHLMTSYLNTSHITLHDILFCHVAQFATCMISAHHISTYLILVISAL